MFTKLTQTWAAISFWKPLYHFKSPVTISCYTVLLLGWHLNYYYFPNKTHYLNLLSNSMASTWIKLTIGFLFLLQRLLLSPSYLLLKWVQSLPVNFLHLNRWLVLSFIDLTYNYLMASAGLKHQSYNFPASMANAIVFWCLLSDSTILSLVFLGFKVEIGHFERAH